MSIYPWQKQQWNLVYQRYRQGNIPHSLLLAGPNGLGKFEFSRHVASMLQCRQPDEQGHSCGQCKGCLLLKAGTHPDMHVVTPEEDSKTIKIDQIRKLCDVMAGKPQLGGYRVAIINPAGAMNINAANGLLKTLEEPGSNTVIMLVCSRPGALPATIRSRCQKVVFQAPDFEISKEWLKNHHVNSDFPLLLGLAQGAPLEALACINEGRLEDRGVFIKEFTGLKQGIQNPLEMADTWKKKHPEYCIHWMMTWVMDLIRLKSAVGMDRLINNDSSEHLQPLAKQLDLKNLFKFLDKCQSGVQQMTTQVNVQLLLEDLFITWIKTR